MLALHFKHVAVRWYGTCPSFIHTWLDLKLDGVILGVASWLLCAGYCTVLHTGILSLDPCFLRFWVRLPSHDSL